MSQDKIDIKDVTPKTFNPKTHKGNGDRFNPSNRIYVRESKGKFQQLRRYGGWFLLLLFALIPWIPFGERQAILLDIGSQQFNFFGQVVACNDVDNHVYASTVCFFLAHLEKIFLSIRVKK